MLFNSYTFAVFFVLVYAAYWLLGHRNQNRLLLVASYVFYGWWDWRFLSLLVLSSVVDYVVALRIADADAPQRRRAWLMLSLITNLGMLGFFKYANFFADSLREACASLGWTLDWRLTDIVLPVGISFYTFQTLCYTIDVYRGTLKPVRNLTEFLLYVSFFPQLVAGPIERASHLIPQIQQRRTITWLGCGRGLWLILVGLFRKVVVADNLAVVVDQVFAAPEVPTGWICLLATYAFAIQIYCDFSGYSDMARGISQLMGFDLMVNFRTPYFATNPSDFWRRWHISLSTWLRDYLFIPLGGSRGGEWQTYRNLMLTMTLGGLWHGASWNCVLWGIYQGLLLCGHRALFGREQRETGHESRLVRMVSIVGMFHLTCLGMMIFRSQSLYQTGVILTRLLTSWSVTPELAAVALPLLLFGGSIMMLDVWQQASDEPWQRSGWNWGLGPLSAALMLLSVQVFATGTAKPFIYFQF